MISLSNPRLLTILLIEDSRSDALLIKEILSESPFLKQLYIVRDGVEATNFLYQREEFSTVPRPDLILLDLNLPKKNGQELLAEIKVDENLKAIPVIILTTSSNPADILKSYQLHANCYLVKPLQLEQFIQVIKSIEYFWLTLVKFPLTQS